MHPAKQFLVLKSTIKNELLYLYLSNITAMSEQLNILLNEVDTLKGKLASLRPLPEEALRKIQDALDIEYTYESNRIEGNTLTLQNSRDDSIFI